LTICQRFGLKTTGTVFSGLTLKPVASIFSGFALKPMVMIFSGLSSKPVVTVSPGLTSKPVVGFLVEPQNQAGGGFPDLGFKTADTVW
jgi:hypothetical protein